MSLDFFENAIDSNLIPDPDNLYRDLNQAFIDEQWDNTTAKYNVFQQNLNCQGEFVKDYTKIEVWMNYVVGQGTSMRNGRDFVQLTFRDINHPTVRGLYYHFEDNYWITTFDDEHDGLVKTVVVRRCNNKLKIVDPDNGSVFSIPCAIDYDMSSPSTQVSRYIITPNNHATVIVQGNKDTIRLFKTNTRYILGGRPFKLTAYQNALFDDETSKMATLLYLDMYLDEIHDKDDLIMGIADNGDYNYQIKINSQNITAEKDTFGNLTADVMLNGEEVDRPIIWGTSNPDAVMIDENGKYTVIGESGQSADIIAMLSGNSNVKDTITITIGTQSVEPKIYLEPAFDKIREYQTIEFDVKVSINGQEIEPDTVSISLDENGSEYLSISQTTTGWKMFCHKRSSVLLTMSVNIISLSYNINQTAQFEIQAVSMMG